MKTDYLQVRLTKAEKRLLVRAARASGLSLSAWVRATLLKLAKK